MRNLAAAAYSTMIGATLVFPSPAVARPLNCVDFRATTDALRDHPELDCNHNGLLDACDVVGVRFIDMPVGTDVGSFKALAAVDHDRDGDQDVVAALIETPDVVLFENDGNGGFTMKSRLQLPEHVRRLASADVDQDGRKDVVAVTVNNLIVIRNKPNGMVADAPISDAAANPDWHRTIEVVDLDGDGLPEVVTTRRRTGLVIFRNASGQLSPSGELLALEDFLGRFTVGDLDADGDQDLIWNQQGRRLRVEVNNGAGAFSRASAPIDYDGDFFTVGDFDRDGHVDVLGVHPRAQSPGSILLLRSDARGGFSAPSVVESFLNTAEVQAVDLDMDGHLDVLVNRGIYAVHFGRGGVPGDGISDDSSIWLEDQIVGDFDGDGRNDIVHAENGKFGLVFRRSLKSPVFDDNRDGTPDECRTGHYYPLRAGNGGPVTIEVSTAELRNGATVQLTKSNASPIAPAAVGKSGDVTTPMVFDLTGAEIGDWDFVALEGGVARRLGPFFIEAYSGVCLAIDAVVPPRVRATRPSTVQVTYDNPCNQEIRGLMVSTRFTGATSVEDASLPAGVSADLAYRTDDGVLHAPVLIPSIPPRSSGTIAFRVEYPTIGKQTFEIAAHSLTPLPDFHRPTSPLPEFRPDTPSRPLPDFQPSPQPPPAGPPRPLPHFGPVRTPLPPPPQWGDCFSKASQYAAKEVLKWGVSQLAPAAVASCAQSMSSLGVSMLEPVASGASHGPTGDKDIMISGFKIWTNVTKSALSCAGVVGIANPELAGILGAIKFGESLYKGYGLATECGKPLYQMTYAVAVVGSHDPNEVTGPAGVCEDRLIVAGDTMTYRVDVENLAAATAPATTIRVRATLPTSIFDYATVRFGSIVLGDMILTTGSQESMRLSGQRAARDGLVYAFEASADEKTATITWTLKALTARGTPVDSPDQGLLPPNRRPPEGQGSISFSIRAHTGTAAVATVSAEVVFDENPPIATNNWQNRIVQGSVPSTCPAPTGARSGSGGCCDAGSSPSAMTFILIGLSGLFLRRRSGGIWPGRRRQDELPTG